MITDKVHCGKFNVEIISRVLYSCDIIKEQYSIKLSYFFSTRNDYGKRQKEITKKRHQKANYINEFGCLSLIS